MANNLKNPTEIEKIYTVLESGMSDNKSIQTYALPNARQWLGGRYFAIWVLPIYIIKKFQAIANSSVFVRPYAPSKSGPAYKQPETLFTSLKMVFQGKDHLRFFDHRFFGIWIFPFAVTGIIFELLFIAPTKDIPPFS
tara:strand:+ start:9890 stop:10303 length:414 start_codon:yes stop_codon:yes gene_type:complete